MNDPREEIRRRINIVDLIGESISLKKAGRNFKALCPFHNEKTPSFIVSPERQIWHCFGCGKGGDAFSFLMEWERIEFPEALKLLADRTGVKLRQTPFSTEKQKLKQKLLEIHHLASEYYHYLLTKHHLGKRGWQYLQSRQIKPKIVNTFSLGFAPRSWDNLVKFLTKKGYTGSLLEKSGLALKGKTYYYDRFRDRLIFPLKNHRGEIIAFSGRLIDPQTKEAKYINSPETLLYTKGEVVYGLEVTKDAIRQQGSAIIVEGEFDVISSFQAGVGNIVAIKGSALTAMQIDLLKRFTERIILSLDQDAAGDAAARRGIELAEKAGMDIRVVNIPQGKDPDEAARSDPLAWKKAVQKAVPIYDFLLESAVTRFDPQDPFGKKKISQELLPILSRIDNPIVQAHYVKLLAEKLALTEDRVMEAMNRQVKKVISKSIPASQTKAKAKPHEQLLEEHLLALILQATDIADSFKLVNEKLNLADLSSPMVKRILKLLAKFLSEQEKFDLNQFVAQLPPELTPAFDQAFLVDIQPFLVTEEKYAKELTKAVTAVLQKIWRRKINQLSTEISQAQDREDESALKLLKQQLGRATFELKKLS